MAWLVVLIDGLHGLGQDLRACIELVRALQGFGQALGTVRALRASLGLPSTGLPCMVCTGFAYALGFGLVHGLQALDLGDDFALNVFRACWQKLFLHFFLHA